MHAFIETLLPHWRQDAGATYQTWFLWPERVKNFRSIRRGIQAVVQEIEADTFGNAYRGSSLETVVKSVAEQRQVFRGADHAFLWKPKLRIPDIYEDRDNQLAFGRFLHGCSCCSTPEAVVSAIHTLDGRGIRGLGPAAANLLYFLHPTLVPPSNTAMVQGYNALTGARVKLGSWTAYLAMREGILRMNERHRRLLSNDLGAIGGLLFDIGSGRYPAPPQDADAATRTAWEADLAQVRAQTAQQRRRAEAAQEEDRTHTEVQGWLRDLGRALGFEVWIASNDRSRPYAGGRLADGCLAELPEALGLAQGADTVRLIDVLWLDGHRIAAGFEVEHTTSIYSGILRLQDLAHGDPSQAVQGLFVVAPDGREDEVRAQLNRPAFRGLGRLRPRYLAYGDLATHRKAMARFGEGLRPIEVLARDLVVPGPPSQAG